MDSRIQNVSFEIRCRNFIRDKKFFSLEEFQEKIINLFYPSGTVHFVDYMTIDDFSTQGIKKVDTGLKFSNGHSLCVDDKFDKQAQNTNNAYLPYIKVKNPKRTEIGWAETEGKEVLYYVMITKNKDSGDGAIPIGVKNVLYIQVTKDFKKYFTNNTLYNSRSVGYRKSNRAEDGSYADSFGRIVPLSDLEAYLRRGIKPKIKEEQKITLKVTLNRWGI